jgi:allantoate deiminase
VVKQSGVLKRVVTIMEESFARLAEEIMERCDALARCTDEYGRITRLFCSPGMREAHLLVSQWMMAAGLAPHVDAAGNLIGAYLPPGGNPQRRILIGSHLDSVANAGRYDGVLGVAMAIAAVDALRQSKTVLPWAVNVIGFSEEEGVRFKTPFIGSRALAGAFNASMLERRDADGITMGDALRSFGADPDAISDCAIGPGNVVAYIEPHIEQGPLLELVGEPVGVVTAIAGQTRMTLQWHGDSGHAGTVAMVLRHDPLVAASRWVLDVAEAGQWASGLVATVGRVDVEPNMPNCSPERVRTSLDVRHHDDAVRFNVVEKLILRARTIAEELGITVSFQRDHEHAAIAMDAKLTEKLAAVITAAGFEPQRLVSGAGHDAGVMAKAAPSAMLFLRCAGGVSHHPREAVTLADVATGLQVLVRFIVDFAASWADKN